MTLGMILMFCLALFIQARLAKARTEHERHAEKIAKLEGELERLGGVEKDRDRLKRELERLGGVEKDRDRLKRELERLGDIEKDRDRLEKELANAQALNAKQENELSDLRERLAACEKQPKPDQLTINRELIGLQGKLKKTAILVDSSGSMQGARWKEAVDVIEIWLNQLPVDRVNLINFNEDIRSYPGPNLFLQVGGTDAPSKDKRRALVQHLRNIQPTGGTFTRGALERAYSLTGLDSIILFTDGAPNTGQEATIVESEVEAIKQLIQKHPDIPINAIGVGEYFDPKLSGFLLEVGRLSKGTFLGR
jgi:hypothetical protein